MTEEPLVLSWASAAQTAGCLHSVNTSILEARGAKDYKTFELQAAFCLATSSVSGAQIFFNKSTKTSN